MTETPTLNTRREQAETAAQEAEQTLQRLETERTELAPEALLGDPAADKRLRTIEKKMAEAKQRKELAEDALAELDKRAEEEQRQAEERRREDLSSRYDELVQGRRKHLEAVEEALDALDKKASSLLSYDQEQRSVAEDLGRRHGQGPYDFILRDRILARLGHLLVGVPGVASGRHEPLTEGDLFLETIAEGEARKQVALREAEEARVEETRVRQATMRAEKLRDRRYELEARFGYQAAVPSVRAELEDEIAAILVEEFPPEEPEQSEATEDRRVS